MNSLEFKPQLIRASLFVHFFLGLTVVFGVISYVSFSIHNHPEYSTWQYVLIGVDRFAMLCVSAELLNNMISGAYLQNLFSHVYGYHFSILNRKFYLLSMNILLTRTNSTHAHKDNQRHQSFKHNLMTTIIKGSNNSDNYNNTSSISQSTLQSKYLSLLFDNNTTMQQHNSNNNYLQYTRFKFKLNQLITRHTSLLRFIFYLNRLIISPELMLFILSNIPFNIYVMSKITIGIFPHQLVMIVTLFQATSSLMINRACIRLNETIHSGSRHLPALQMNMMNINMDSSFSSSSYSPSSYSSSSTKKSWLSEKIHLLTLFEQLNNDLDKSRLGFTVGPIVLVNANSSFKVYNLSSSSSS